MSRIMVAIFLAATLAGCVTPSPVGAGHSNGGLDSARRLDVQAVGLTDTGINPYQASFAAQPEFEDRLAAAVNATYTTVSLAKSGSLEERLAADSQTLQALKPGQLYHFAGTRILAISFVNRSNALSNERHAIYDDDGHGTQTSSLVAGADPDAIIVMAQVQAQVCDSGRCIFDPSVAEGLKWLADQPWIDVISVSMAIPGAPPDPSVVHPEAQAFLDASRAAAASGKLVVVGAGNLPNPTLTGYTSGPPWVITAGGYEPTNHGEPIQASKGVDVVANFTALVADPKATNGSVWNSGTSFSTPIVAGTLSRALGDVRSSVATLGGEADLRLRAADPTPYRSALAFRAALNASARGVSASDYDPTQNPENNPLRGRVDSPAIPILSPSQDGWGVISSGVAADIASRVLSGQLAAPQAKSANELFQTQWQASREAYWN